MDNEYVWDVFISYDSRDKLRVERLAERLRAAGLKVWFDKWIIKPGDDIYAAIEHGLEYSRVLLVCMSPASMESRWTAMERNTILFQDPQNSNRRLIPLLFADCSFPPALRRLHWIDWRDENDSVLADLIQSCHSPTLATASDQQIDLSNIAPPGGAIHHDDPFYIERAADAEVVSAARRAAGTLVIKAARQMGKSTLLKRYLAECQESGKMTVLLDFSIFTRDDLDSYPTFLANLAEAIWKGLGQTAQAMPNLIESQSDFIRYIEHDLLMSISGEVVFAFDESDKILGYAYQDDFFSMLRYCHERRTDTPITNWTRASIALVISTEPYLLIDSSLRSPFNITPPILLSCFDEEQCHELNQRYRFCLHDSEVADLVALVGGHPYLVRLAYYHLTCQNPISFSTLVREAAERFGPFGIHLRSIERKLGDDTDQTLISAMHQIIRDGITPNRDVIDRLVAVGLVRENQGRIVPANLLYERFFGAL